MKNHKFTGAFSPLLATVLMGVLAGSSLHADGRKPGSALIFPIHRSGPGLFTVVSVTNTELVPATPISLGGTTGLHYEYVNVVPNPNNTLLPIACEVVDRIELLTPADTNSRLTTCHNATGGQEGYLVVSALDPNQFNTPWSHNSLIGSQLVVNGLGALYSINAIAFESPQPKGSITDLDADGQLDFDGLEYEGIPDELYVDNFVSIAGSSLTLINLTGGTGFKANLQFDIFNDNEFSLSSTVTFRCWIEEELSDLSPVFNTQFLFQNTPHDPSEFDVHCDNIGDFETGWVRIRGLNASSSAQTVPDPAIVGALTVGTLPGFKLDGGRLLWESFTTQTNGDFLKFGNIDFEQ